MLESEGAVLSAPRSLGTFKRR
ncbi:hypothetical protein FQN60_008984, partial [Etheostoma spectabile]